MKKYQKYLNSKYWKRLKSKYYEIRPKKCSVCGNSYPELHHLSYKNLRKESSSDLVPVCRTCHQNIHNSLYGYKKSLKNSALAYANGLQLNDPRISPLFAEIDNFPPTLIIEGTKDIFLSTSTRFYQKLESSGVNVKLDLNEGMWHVFTMFDIPESKITFEKIAKFLHNY